MGIFLTPLVKSEINWFYSCKARQRCISSFDSAWQPVKVLWIFHCLKNQVPPHRVPLALSPSFLSLSPCLSLFKLFFSVVLPISRSFYLYLTSVSLPSCSSLSLCLSSPMPLWFTKVFFSTRASHWLWHPGAAQCQRWHVWTPLEC